MIPLRWRLTLWNVGLTAFGLLGFTLISYRFLSDSLHREVNQILVERANHVTDAVMVIPNRPIEGISPEATDEFRTPGVYVQIFNPKGEVVARSFNLGLQKLPVEGATFQRVMKGESFYATTDISGQPVRLYFRPIQRDDEIVGAVQVGQTLTNLETTLNQIKRVYQIGTATLLVFSLISGIWLARSGLRPVVRVTQAARRIVREEDLSHRVPQPATEDEIGMLATTFNEMLDRLQALFEGQRHFLAEAAHELRTPLASMLGNIDLLARYGDDPNRRAETEQALQRTGKHVARLLDDLMTLAQAGAGWRLHLRQIALDSVFMEAYEAAQSGGEGVKLQLDACQPAWVLGDPDRLRQVLDNLIDNALKYSRPGGVVRIALRRAGKHVQLRISDQGEGISPEAMGRIFDPFFREPNKTRHPGAGLGLTIARWIVREHSGEMAVESEPGLGTTITLTFPAYEG
jgi:signal transduction histidine kinase